MAPGPGAGYAETTYDVPANNGTPVKIPCTLMSVRRMEIYEVPADSSAAPQTLTPAPNPQGLQYQFALRDGSFGFDGQWKVQASPGLPIVLGQQVNEWKARGQTLGNKALTDPAGQTYGPDYPIRLLSQTSTATHVAVREYQ